MAQGFILEVSVSRIGDELDFDHLAGETVLQLLDVTDFIDEEDPVDEIEVDGVVYPVVNIDTVAQTINIGGAGLENDLQAGERVYTVPASLEKWAMVEINGEDEPVSALVGGDVYDKITDGIREPEDQEAVIVEMQNGDWTVINLVGEEPTTDGTFLDPTTVPVPSEVSDQLVDLRTEVGTNTGQLEDILGNESQAGRLQNVEETATQARNLANTADGRVSMSDYDPAPADVSYIATNPEDGTPILDDLGNPVLLQRNEGSIWFTRTRARVNICSNPSFETNLLGWVATDLVMSREIHANAPAGSYVLELTNNTATGLHYMSWNNGGDRFPVVGGAAYTGSAYAEAVSGDNTGVFARMQFYDAGGVSLGYVDGEPVDLVTGDWSLEGVSQRPYVTAVAPDDAASAVVRIMHPHDSSVWRMDAVLIELSNHVGRYFDGSLYDSRWGDDGAGTAHASESYMGGGIITRIWELDDGAWVEKFLMGDTLLDLNASQIRHGFMDGERIQDRSIPIDKIAGVPCVAFEGLAAGDLVHISNEDGAFQARKASAADGIEAHGFVLENVSSGAVGYVYSHGYNPFMSDLEPGTQFLSTSPGAVSSTPPQDVGTMVQRVGSAVGDSVLNFVQGDPIYIT